MTDSQETPKPTGWAKPVDTLKVKDAPKEAINLNVEGRHLTGLVSGFGQMWQKTYRVRLSGVTITPAEAIKIWKENFPSFWPKGNNLYVPLTGIKPGEVGLINLSVPGGMKLSTGILVVYADDISFSFMTPEGHILSGMITFSGESEDDGTVIQIQALIRPSDPLYEIGFRLGFGHKMEDVFWLGTLTNLAKHLGVTTPHVTQTNTLVDPRVQWKEAKNIWKNAAIRSTIFMPVVLVKRLFVR